MPENFVPLHTEVERISSGDVQRQDVADYLVRHGQLSPYEARPLPLTGNSYDEYEQSIFSDFVGEFWNNSVVSAARGFANQIPISALADRLNPLQRSITPNERIAWAANLIGKEDAYRNSIVGKLLGNIESKYKKVGGYIVSDPLGLSSLNAAAGKVVGQEVRDDFFKNWIASVDKITESWKAPVTESKSFFQDPSGRSLVKGLGQGLGFISSVLVTKKAGAAASMATSVVQMTPMYYDEAKAAGLTDEQAASFATALAPIVGATEYFGLEAVGKVAMKPALNALRKESVVAGAKAFTRVLEETGSGQKALNAAIKESNTVFGKSLKTIGVGMASGAAIEGGEEFGQTYIEEGYKQYFDKVVLPESKFGADVRSREALLKASEGAFFGGILGGLLAGGHGVFSAPSNQEVVEQSMFNIIDSSNNKEKALSGILSNVETAKAKNTISDKEYEGAKQMAQSLYEYVKSVPVSLNNTTAKYQAYKFISDRNLAAEQLQALDSRGTDPLLATADDDMRGFLEGVIGVYNEAIETIGKTKGQVSDAEIERRITELRNTYFQTAEDTAVETEEAGIGEGVAADNQGIEDIGAAELEPIDGVIDGVNEGVNEGVIEGVGQDVQENAQATVETPQVTPQVEKPIAEQVAEYEGILSRNQAQLDKLRKGKLRKGETQEKRDTAIANLEQQESMVREKLDALKQQMPKVEVPAVQSVFEQIGKLRDNITAKGGKRKEKKDAFTTFVGEQPERVRFVHDNFKTIVNQLEEKGLLKKSSPEC